MENISLIDADSIIYYACYSKKDKPVKTLQDIINCTDEIVNDILLKASADIYCGFLTDGSFRYKIATIKPYKGNRSVIKPTFFNTIKGYLRDQYKFISIKDYEADDLCIMAHRTFKEKGYNPIIASPDKDLRQIEGKFYDYKTREFDEITQEEADRNFWMQMLTGDAGDNIQGIPGIGEVKAHKILSNCDNYANSVFYQYMKYYDTNLNVIKSYNETYQLLKMLDEYGGELYQPEIIYKKDTIKDGIDNLWLR